MSGVEQLELDIASKSSELCRCGHEQDQHKGGHGRCERCGAHIDACVHYRPMGLPIEIELPKGLQKPAGALDLIRPELKRRKGKSFEARKRFGWVLVSDTSLLAYLSQLEVISPNKYKAIANSLSFGRITLTQHKGMMANLGEGEAMQRERAMLAIETAHVEDRGKPSRCVLTRVACRAFDGDNHQAALKHVRDGVAEGLLESSDRLFDNGVCELKYATATPGKRGIFGVRIELSWGAK